MSLDRTDSVLPTLLNFPSVIKPEFPELPDKKVTVDKCHCAVVRHPTIKIKFNLKEKKKTELVYKLEH